jgi:hypothetical protein
VDDLSVTEPAAAGEPATAITQPIPVIAEACSQCAAPLAPDQRYCLHCGAPRAHVSGSISGGRPGGPPPQAAAPSSSSQAPPPGVPGGPPATPPGVPLAPAQPGARNNTLALLAGIGVLLLAMGVGVLIGRADAGSVKAPPAQVISLGGAGAGAATTATTATTPTTETPAAGSAKKSSKAKASSSSGSGASIGKPAPPTVLKSVSKGQSGSSYEQKSKSLPDVVETG